MSSYQKVSGDELKEQANNNYRQIIDVFRQYGEPNPQFPNDKDMYYADVREHLPAMGGIGTILKNMKREQRVDYRDPFIKDDTLLTLVEDYNQDFKSVGVTYEEINDKIVSDVTTHQKMGGWDDEDDLNRFD
eukprot:TRINITY_DN16403_c0_g1_i1.p2 TRINITY_DN16403_c0_g1~~TRINITY_DN16403_c0_g1_i1.p2  ORF type:complete len:146 (-),score=58.76 TRINITY_DN16403_c0_g1_i1:211-606(-)